MFTGYNPEEAEKDLSNFILYGEIVTQTLDKAIDAFFKGLGLCWFSPKAQEFEQKYRVKLLECKENLYVGYYNVAFSATQAYNLFAQHNNLKQLNTENIGYEYYKLFPNIMPYVEGTDSTLPSIHDSKTPSLYSKTEDASGNVGMDKGMLADVFGGLKMDMDCIFQCIDETPYKIAFYDVNGELAASFKSEIDAFSQKGKAIIKALKMEMTIAKQLETKNVEAPSKEATEYWEALQKENLRIDSEYIDDVTNRYEQRHYQKN